MQQLKPQVVIPGHYLGARPAGDKAVTFTLDYLQSFERALQQHKGSAAVIQAMKQAWPTCGCQLAGAEREGEYR